MSEWTSRWTAICSEIGTQFECINQPSREGKIIQFSFLFSTNKESGVTERLNHGTELQSDWISCSPLHGFVPREDFGGGGGGISKVLYREAPHDSTPRSNLLRFHNFIPVLKEMVPLSYSFFWTNIICIPFTYHTMFASLFTAVNAVFYE